MMENKIEKLLNETYKNFLNLLMYDYPLDKIEVLAVNDVMGYGTTIDEKIYNIDGLSELVKNQREQSEGKEIHFDVNPVFRKYFSNDKSAFIVDEIRIKMLIDGNQNEIPARFSSIFEYKDEKWKLVHFHASVAVETENDSWHINEWKKKNEELQKLVDEKTTDIVMKNRELEIESSLERVRSRTMAMHQSNELAETAVLLFQQFETLTKLPKNALLFIAIVDEESDSVVVWMTKAGGTIRQESHRTPLNEHPSIKSVYDAWKRNEPFHIRDLKGKELADYLEYVSTLPHVRDNKDKGLRELITSAPKRLVFSEATFKQGFIGVMADRLLKEETQKLLIRFARVFELTYTRFLDLQNAESQAREAQIETGLEKVRADMMAMHKSDELRQVVGSVFKQLQNLGFDAPTCSVIIYDEDFSAEHWFSGMGQDIYPKSYKIPYVDNPYFTDLLNAWKKGISFREFSMEGKLKIEYGKWLLEHSEFIKLPEEFRKDMLTPDRLVLSDAFMRYGMIEILGPEPLPAEKASILQRFSKVFEQTYTRFLDLQNAEEQNLIIQAENERKTQELEEARQLQLAMLPKELPKLSDIDIAVYMQTATEVGGDYYDFRVGLDGTLNVVLGDATGHGLKAGTLVTIIKGLFTAEAENNEVLTFFNKSSKAIKELKLGRLMMAFVFLKIKGKQLSLSNAGIPPVYIFRSEIEEVEEIDNKGMPLGAMKNFPYKETKIELNKGDVILLLSDGLPELFNDKKEMFGYDRVKETFIEVAAESSEKIIEHLKNTASDWSGGKEPDDDVTFVVLKMKQK